MLLVEGKDDEHVLMRLANHYQIQGKFRIKPKGGITNLRDTLDVELLASDLERLGIVVDANTDLQARWQSLRDVLTKSGYTNVPLAPSAEGTIIFEVDKPTVGVWLMPDNMLPGMLENFARFLIPQNDNLWLRAQACVDSIPDTERRFSSNQLIKAQLHTWMAWQAEPGTPIGQAITKQYLDANAAHAQRFIE